MAQVDRYIFNPATSGHNIISPRPANIALKRTTIYDEADANDPKLVEKYKSLGQRNERQHLAIKALPPHDITTLDGAVILHGQSEQPASPDEMTARNLSAMFESDLDWTYRCYEVTRAGEEPRAANERRIPVPGFQTHLYLFNVIVAFEWEPTIYDMGVLERAVRRAADFLYDVTDGWMSFGQVIIGGPELLSCADVQVLASNRLHPRVWVGGMHVAAKYVPVRLGRGLWQKNSRVSIPWDEPEGYRLLIHEWGHYALELIDGYLEIHQVYIPGDVKSAQGLNEARRSNRELVVSTISQPVESIMARLEGTSELVPKRQREQIDGKFQEWDTIISGYLNYGPRFPRIKDQPQPLEGPLPLRDLPHVVRFRAQAQASAARLEHGSVPAKAEAPADPGAAEEILLFDIPAGIQLEHCWVYLLKYDRAKNLYGIVAQGTLDNRLTDGFRLLGAAKGDRIVLVGDTSKYEPIVWRATIVDTKRILNPSDQIKDGRPERYVQRAGWRLRPWEGGSHPWRTEAIVDAWEDWTPRSFPLIDVMPSSVRSDAVAAGVAVRVVKRVAADLKSDTSPNVTLIPLDDPHTPGGAVGPIKPIPDATLGILQSQAPVSLDGHIFAEWPESKQLVIATFSQGGGPPTGSPVNGAPITAGSADGNLMIFFDSRGEVVYRRGDHAEIRVVTTRQPGLDPKLAAAGEPGAEPRGYVFSLGSNGPLPLTHKPTLVIAFDKDAEFDEGELIIHRMDRRGTWQPVPTYRPRGAWYVATPLNEDTAPNLTSALLPEQTARVERFCIFLVPRQLAGSAAPL